jgi:hypothetical protein
VARPRTDSITFRLEAGRKAALTRLARRENKAVGELMRELAEAHLRQQERGAWEAEARRQSRAIARRASDPSSDEAKTAEWIEQVSDDLDWDA